MKKSLISAVKKLLAKLGAEEVEGNNLVEVIDSGADAIEGGGGDSNIEYVNIIETMDEHHQIIFSVDKSYAEILALFNAGKQVYFKNDTWGCSLTPVQKHPSGTFFATFFNRAEIFSTPKQVIFYTFSIDSSNTLTRTQSTISAT